MISGRATLICAIVASFILVINVSAQDDKLKACGDATKKQYDDICKITKKDAAKVRAIKDKCVSFPPELDANVIDIMKECDKANNPCDEAAMSKCGEDMLPKAATKFEENRKKDGKTPATLMDLYNEQKDSLVSVCEKAKKCIEENMPKA